jgi:hypothetical protein
MHLHPLTKEDPPTSNDNLKETMMATTTKKTTATPVMGMPGTMGTTPASNHRDDGQTAATRNSLQGRSEEQQQGEGMATMMPPLLRATAHGVDDGMGSVRKGGNEWTAGMKGMEGRRGQVHHSCNKPKQRYAGPAKALLPIQMWHEGVHLGLAWS